MQLPLYSPADYTEAQRALLPPGAAFNWPQGGMGDVLLGGMAQELARVGSGAQQVLDHAPLAHLPKVSSWHISEYRRIASEAIAGQVEVLPRQAFTVGSKVGARVWSNAASIRLGTAQAATPNTVTLPATASAVPDVYAGKMVGIVSGMGIGQEHRVVQSRTNKLSYSNSFTNPVWINSRCTLLPNQQDPFGGQNGWKYSVGGIGGYIDQGGQAMAQDELTFYAKPDVTGWALMTFKAYLDGTETAWFNLLTGTLGVVGSNLTASITPAGNGYWKCSARKRVATISNYCIFAPTWGNGISGNTNCSMFCYIAHLSDTSGDEPLVTLANPTVGVTVDTPWTTQPDSTSVLAIYDPSINFSIPLLKVDHLLQPLRVGSKVGDGLWGSNKRYLLRVRYYRSVVNPKPLWDALMAFKQAHVFLWFEDISGAGGIYEQN